MPAPGPCQHAVNTTVSCSIMSTHSQHNTVKCSVNTTVSCSVNTQSPQHSQLLHECFPGTNAGWLDLSQSTLRYNAGRRHARRHHNCQMLDHEVQPDAAFGNRHIRNSFLFSLKTPFTSVFPLLHTYLGPCLRTEVTAATRWVAPPTLEAAARRSFMWSSAFFRIMPRFCRTWAATRKLLHDT